MTRIAPQLAPAAGIVNGVEFVCPFCKLRAAASVEEPQVVHEKPACSQFESLEVVEYLASCRKHFEEDRGAS